jgi:hypothetical protein
VQVKRWQRFALLASVVWVTVGCLLASWNEAWIAAWKLYCSITANPACVGATVFLAVHWGAIAGVVFYPLILAWLIVWGLVAVRRRTRRSRHGRSQGRLAVVPGGGGCMFVAHR